MDAKTYTTWQLARFAECYDPDRHDGIGFDQAPHIEEQDGSPGAEFLRSIAYAVEDYLDRRWTDEYMDAAHEIADGAVPVYTHTLWQTFTDLGAYTEDPTDLGADAEDMTAAASTCLYIIASRLALVLIEAETAEDDDIWPPH